ncbi:hypothetical protein HMPREF9318_01132 [Streptococcus urinalis FB127-CNA-2]|uniref:Glucosyltransferase 3 n=1 Tax=Streptococcus urinalis 2285-97 TaxID=764291 RepID=G5KHS6_9STRE|nr:sugar transferase [Streptococcus urinalis]EHJ57473.1 hypothetical protein STRUR_0289 [Streptococcus urinalis 2285-97]EKS20494.1 hypothetical protein HMPREF9318_01132 [Streptococcus urinalis FB127-CNA-2]VEF31188.1 nucleotide sugar synthetase-like protein [Streptococcus urinalis]
MKVHITNLYGQAATSVALIAQNMVAEIAKNLGYREIGIYSYPVHTDTDAELSKRVDGMLAAVSNGDVVIVQSPSWNSTEFDDYVVNKLKSYKDIKVILFIHDIIPLMFKSNEYLIDKTIETYNKADLLILPSKKMETELRRWGLKTKKILIQHLWDHPTQLWLDIPPYAKKCHFTGSSERFTFVKDWRYSNPLFYYGLDQFDYSDLNVSHQGWKSDTELLQTLAHEGGLGLVWSQKSDVDYYEWNASYKLSTYLAAGLPVIVQDNLSNHEWISRNGLGMVVSSLEEANERLEQLSPEEYQVMCKHVQFFRPLVTQGYFSRKVLTDAVFEVLQNDIEE